VCYSLWSRAPEDGRNHRPKHVQLIGIVNKPLLLHLVGCLHYRGRECLLRGTNWNFKSDRYNFVLTGLNCEVTHMAPGNIKY